MQIRHRVSSALVILYIHLPSLSILRKNWKTVQRRYIQMEAFKCKTGSFKKRRLGCRDGVSWSPFENTPCTVLQVYEHKMWALFILKEPCFQGKGMCVWKLMVVDYCVEWICKFYEPSMGPGEFESVYIQFGTIFLLQLSAQMDQIFQFATCLYEPKDLDF